MLRKRIISLIAALMLLVGLRFTSLIGCSVNVPNGETPGTGEQPNEPDEPGTDEPDGYPTELFDAGVYNASKTEYSAEYLGEVARRRPEVSNGGLERYPEYGVTLSGTTAEEKQAILAENSKICASSETYDGMDADGNLYLNGEATGEKLYKHTASFGMYEGDLRDDEPAVAKKITMRARSMGNHITGLYAPAGEVIKIEMSEKDLAATGGLIVRIGQVLQNGQANNIWSDRDFNRMPVIVNSMTINETEGCAGWHLGGPIYVQPVNAGVKFTVTVSGGVPYSHYIHGYTTKEEFEEYKNSSAPYFDLEVWDDAVRHSGPKARAEQFSYEELVDAAVLWDKISRVSNQVPSGSNKSVGITFLYDPFIAAGAMVAFVGRSTVNCPLYCMTAALDAESAIDNASDAFWGCIHEYNHHYQKFGVLDKYGSSEVTNNAVSLAAYSLYTRISANRELGNADEGSYATGWNRYTNPSWTLKQTLANGGKNENLDGYANLLHSFGQTRFLQATQNGGGRGNIDTWYRAVSDATQYDMTYYFKEILHQTVSDGILQEYKQKNYPMYVPVATIYQTGVSYTVGEKKYYSRTAQPYGIETGQAFEIDLKENLVIPSGFTWQVKKITNPAYGTLTKKSEGIYTYMPDENNRESGKICVTLGITKDDGAFEVEDVDIVIELRQKQYRPTMLERTVYTYTNETMYDSAKDAAENGYKGYETVREEDNSNRIQNGNSEIWEPNPGSNAVMEIRGKFEIKIGGKYRVALRGRDSAALYVSEDGKDYRLAASFDTGTGSGFDVSRENTYKDYTFQKGQWVYFKAVLLVTKANNYVGVGLGKFNGENVNVSYLNAYRNSYYKEAFESDYYYPREYGYDHLEESGNRQTLVATNYKPWDDSYSIENLFDENKTNYIHSNKENITEENPFELTVDLGETVRANRFTICGESSKKYQPKNFKLYGGTDKNNLTLLKEVENAQRINSDTDIKVEFDERELHYYKLVVTDTYAEGTKYIAYREARVTFELFGGTLLSPDEELFEYRGGWALSNQFSTFGHLYEGENATLDFTFTGKRFGIFAYESSEFDGFEVLIDGKLIDTVSLNGDGNGTKLAYLSDELPEGTHQVTIRSKTKFNIDSIVLWRGV